MRCTLSIPQREVVRSARAEKARRGAKTARHRRTDLRLDRVSVVEDEALVAMMI